METQKYTTQGTIPPVGTSEPTASEPAASASDLAFGGGGGGGRAAAGAGAGAGGGGGDSQRLPDETRAKFESSLGEDLSGVRVHTGPGAAGAAESSQAKAVATGKDIHFAEGQYDPSSPKGEKLLAHEVAHTVQQKDAAPQPQKKDAGAVATPADGAEVEADHAATAMVAGKPAQVSPIAQQGPHADKQDAGPTWQQLLDALNAALKKSDWADCARRLNGLSHDDIKWYCDKYLKDSPGKVAHIREAAVVVMPGYSQHVTNAIDEFDATAGHANDSKNTSEAYLAYDKALDSARATHDWHDVANRLAGMGTWDQNDRLSKLTWFDLEGIRGANPTAAVRAAVDAADLARARAVIAAYNAEVNSGQWAGAAAHLHGMSNDDIHTRLEALKFTQLSALKPFASARIAPMIDAELSGRSKAEQDPDQTKPRQVDGAVEVVAPLVELPDFSDDVRTTKEAHDGGGIWSGSVKLQTFVEALAKAFAERKADQQIKDKPGLDRAATVEKIRAEELHKLQNQWWRVINEYQLLPKAWPKFAIVAKYWCSDVSQGKLFALDKDVGSYAVDVSGLILPKDDVAAACEPMINGGNPPVRHIVNDFMRNLDTNPSRYFYNYPNHGGGKLMGQGFSVDVMMDASNAGRNDEGFTPRESALQMIHNIAKAAELAGGDWQVCYNDYSVAMAAKAAGYGNRISHVGVNSKDDNGKQDMGNLNGHGTHAPLNLHFHVDIVPLKSAPKSDDGDKKGEPAGSPIGIKPPAESH